MSADLVRLTVNMNRDTADALQSIVFARDITYTEAIRRAVAVYKYVEDETAKGQKVIVQYPDGADRREVVLL